MSAQLQPHPQFVAPQRWTLDIYRKRMVLMMIVTHQDWFRDNDLDWVTQNFHIWEAFEREADLIWNSGRRHWSARTIGEYLRHETAIREGGDGTGFKVNDHAWPSLARIYMLMHPDREGFFERRPGQSGVRAQ